ncbi:MAG: hypothetical protein P8Y99_00340 [Calditrichaceae bacterium]
MNYVRRRNPKIVTEKSLLDHVKEVSDDCKCYEFYLKTGQGRIEDILEKVLSGRSEKTNMVNIVRGFIQLKPFLDTEKEVIFGFNARYMECRCSIFKNTQSKFAFYLLILFNYNSKIIKYLFWPFGLSIRYYIIFRLKRALLQSEWHMHLT